MIMKFIAAGAIAAALTACAGSMFGGGNGPAAQLETKTAAMVGNVAMALGATSIAFVSGLEAVGNKTEAERIKAETDGLRGEDDLDKLEAGMGTLNEVDLTAQLNNAGELSEEGKQKITESMLHLGIAIYFDGMAAAEAPGIVSEAQDLQDKATGTDALAIPGIITNGQWLATNAPAQLSLLKDTFAAVKSYAEAHGIEVPSQDEIDAAAKDMAKE